MANEFNSSFNSESLYGTHWAIARCPTLSSASMGVVEDFTIEYGQTEESLKIHQIKPWYMKLTIAKNGLYNIIYKYNGCGLRYMI